jgi:hypothetical protein
MPICSNLAELLILRRLLQPMDSPRVKTQAVETHHRSPAAAQPPNNQVPGAQIPGAQVPGMAADTYRVVGVGQSNIARYFAGDQHGKKYFEENLPIVAQNFVKDAEFINSAFGGSSVLKENASASARDNYWAVMTTEGSLLVGPRLQTTIQAIRQLRMAGKSIDLFLWAQGEADAVGIETRARATALTDAQRTANINADLLRYEKGLRWIVQMLQKEAGSVSLPFGIQALGQRVSLANTQIAIHKIRAVQVKVAQSTPSVKILAQMYDSPLEDSVHLNSAGQEIVLSRIIKNIKQWNEQRPLKVGPSAATATISENQRAIHVKINSTGTFILGQEALRLFSVVDSNYNIVAKPVSQVRLNDTTLTLRFSSPISASHRLVIGFGVLSDLGASDKSLREIGRSIYDPEGFPNQPGELNLN